MNALNSFFQIASKSKIPIDASDNTKSAALKIYAKTDAFPIDFTFRRANTEAAQQILLLDQFFGCSAGFEESNITRNASTSSPPIRLRSQQTRRKPRVLFTHEQVFLFVQKFRNFFYFKTKKGGKTRGTLHQPKIRERVGTRRAGQRVATDSNPD